MHGAANQIQTGWGAAVLAMRVGVAGMAAMSALAQPAAIRPSASSAVPNSVARTPSPSPIQTQFKAFKVIFLSGGKEELEPASSVSPGDVVAYVAVHRNVSAKRLLNTDFAIPIPYGTTLWQGSIQPEGGLLTQPAPASGRKTKDSDRPRVVWRVSQLDPGQSVEFRLRVSIDPDPSLGTPAAPNPFRPAQPQLRRP